MLKKLLLPTFLIISTIVSAGNSASQEQAIPSFDTREAIAEYAFEAMTARNAKALLNTFTPEAIQQGIKIFGSRENLEAACQEFLNLATDASISQMRRAKSRIIRDLANDRDLVQINGKWYSSQNWERIAQTYVIANFIDAASARNTDALWELLCQETRERITQDANGDQQKLKQKLTDLCKGFIRDEHIEKTRANRSYVISALLDVFTRTGVLTGIDGKYFINLIPLIK